VFADKNKSRAYRFTKYKITLLADVDIQKFVRKLVDGMAGFLRVSVDCWVSTVSYSTQLDDNGDSVVVPKYGLVYPNFWGSLNDTEMLRSPQDLEDLIEELDPVRLKEKTILNTFAPSNGGNSSGVNVHRILAFEVLVACYPSGFLLR
jgi:hypothetical protein